MADNINKPSLLSPEMNVDHAPAFRTYDSSRPSTANSTTGIAASSVSLSFATRISQQKQESHLNTKRSHIEIVESDRTMRDIERGAPGDPSARRKSQLNPDIAKKKNAYFENEFAAGTNRDPEPARTRIENDALVMAEIKTNVIVRPSLRLQLPFG